MMLAILTLALLLRLPFLGQSLWLDEAIEALALQGRMGPILDYALSDFQPPLYHGILYLFTQVFGTSEVALRLPSLLAGLGVVYFGGKLVEQISSRKAGTIAALLLATNPLLIYYSAEGRTYMLTAFFVAFSFWSIVKSRKLFLAVATLGVVWTSYLGWIVVALQAIYLLLTKNRALFIPLMLGATTITLWLPSFLGSLGIGLSTLTTSPEWGRVVGGLSLKSLPLTWVKFVLGRISFADKLLYAAVAGGVFVAHALALIPHSKLILIRHKTILLWLVGPLTLGALIAIFIPVYQYFRVLFVLPAYLILLALALAEHKKPYLTVLILTLQLIFVAIYLGSPRFHHEDWRQVVADYGEDAVYALPSRNQNAPLLYYGVTKPQVLEPKVDTIPGLSRIIYIRYAEDVFDASKLGAINLRAAGYTITSEASYPGLAVEVYTK